LTGEHLGIHAESILGEITRIVGEKNVIELVEGKYLIVIPTDPLSFPAMREKMRFFVGEVEGVLSKYNLLMN
jgi:hypothetical protein